MTREHNAALKERVARQKAFFESDKPGDLLVYVNRGRHAPLESFLCTELFQHPADEVLEPAYVDDMIDRYVTQLRESLPGVYAIDDDMIPCALVYWGIGCITAAMAGGEPLHDEITSWLEPNLSWEEIGRLRFDPDNKWVRFALHINQALWKRWEEDFFVLPFLHRSPLDAANGIRGTELFTEMYTDPERVKGLIDWCADWMIAVERFIDENVDRPRGWGNGVWDTWLPDGGVFVNGDPVGLISREMMPVFEQPYTAKLFTTLGGGFFHSHTVGLYQVDQVAKTPGIRVQEFVPDPKEPNVQDVLLSNDKMRDTILSASLDSPIMIEGVMPDQLDDLLPIVRQGRFILACGCGEDGDPNEMVRKARAAAAAG